MALDPRRQRIRRNMARAWAYAASAYQASASISLSVSFTPAVLFGSGTYNGFWIDPSDLSSLKQSTNGSGAVATVGDPVGYILEKSGAGGIFTATDKPTFQTVSGNAVIRFATTNVLNGDAPTHKMVTAGQSVATYVFAATWSGTASNNVAFSHKSDLYSGFMRTAAGNLRFFFRDNGIFIDVAGTQGTKYVLTGIWQAGGTTVFRINGVQVGTFDSSGQVAWFGPGQGTFIGDNTFTSYMTGDIYQGFGINRVLSGTDLSNIETYIGAKAGVTI
jgi:hypothetical protein